MSPSNRWNRFIYACWAPFYDLFVQVPLIAKARARAIDKLCLHPGEHVCLIGVGTGADFPFLPEGLTVEGVDLSIRMLAQARRKLPVSGCDITLSHANAEELPFPDKSFEVVFLTLILSVAADGHACMREAARVVRPGGRLLVFDKFLPPDSKPSLLRQILNLLTRFFGTDINRSFESMIAGLPVQVITDQPALLRRAYRTIVLEKNSSIERNAKRDDP